MTDKPRLASNGKEHLPWHRRFPKDMLLKSMRMDLRDFGAYCIVLDLIYYHGGSVADDAALISRYMRGCNAIGWNNIRSRLLESGHIYEHEGTLRSRRSDAELVEASRVREANSMGGLIAQARRAKRLHHPPDRPDDHPSHPPGRWSKSRTTSAENNELAQVHSSYTHTQPQTQTERREEGSAEEERLGRSSKPHWSVRPVSQYLEQQLKNGRTQ